MADFDLTQTDQQVQNILNDGQSAMGAGAQTTLTTEYVMLKDTNGVYHKILKSSFTEAIRDVLAGLLVNNDKGTTINQIAAIASGDFGSITPANLASVLGEPVSLQDDTDANTIINSGAYYVLSINHTAAENNYPDINGMILVSAKQLTPSIKFIWQRFFNTANNQIFIRWGRTDRNEWTSWKEL